jgi:hypothetical protein
MKHLQTPTPRISVVSTPLVPGLSQSRERRPAVVCQRPSPLM